MARLSLLVLILAVAAPPAHAQFGGLVDRVRDRISTDAQERIERRAVEAARRTLDLAENAVVCAVTDEDCIREAEAQGEVPVVVNEEGQPVSGYEPAGEDTPAAGPDPSAVWANYDFVPGERVLFVHDFEGTRVGNFPSRLGYIAGNLDVVELGSGDAANRVLRVGGSEDRGGNGCFTIELPETLPDRFTLEFRTLTTDPNLRDRINVFSDSSVSRVDTRCTYPPDTELYASSQHTGLYWPGVRQHQGSGYAANEWGSYALGCDGDYCKLFVNGVRKANVPRWEFPRAAALHVFMNVYRHSLYLDDVRITEGGRRSLYDDLEADGEISTTAIRFDTGSATIKPESSGYLDQVVEMLAQHEALRLEIQGHTDAEGSDTSNQALSERRADSVRGFLEARGVADDRLTTVGFGESRPAADNATPEGRAQNRRVVFKRL